MAIAFILIHVKIHTQKVLLKHIYAMENEER
jgi:hypothetical protein